ncbi:MAG TPA: response regulator [Acidimicrobiales bacterium]|jgi:CheY-like chemotaxis protein|nr:response regulator [Acidimicrobiales bacterium]
MPDRGRPGSLSYRLSATTRILAVEDEDDIAEFLRAYFRASGYDLVHVDPASAQEVVDAVDEHKPDLILLDYGLRGFSGHEAYRLLRSHERFAFLPVVVVTGDASAREKTADTASGLDGFVAKPFNVNTLADLVAARIDAARDMAEAGRDETFGVMTQAYLTARLSDEINGATPNHAVCFALVQVRSLGRIRRDAGTDGVTYVVRKLIDIARDHLPTESILGRTDTNELAVLVSGPKVGAIEPLLAAALAATPSTMDLPGGATVDVELAAGLASFPEHAGSVDELYVAAEAALADAVDGDAALRVAM